MSLSDTTSKQFFDKESNHHHEKRYDQQIPQNVPVSLGRTAISPRGLCRCSLILCLRWLGVPPLLSLSPSLFLLFFMNFAIVREKSGENLVLQVDTERSAGVCALHTVRRGDRADPRGFLAHEGHETHQDVRNTPMRIPTLRVVVAVRQTKLRFGLKTSSWCQHDD